jgi:hypothetical protein
VIGSRPLGLDDALAEEGTLPGDSGVEDLCQAPANDVCVSTTERGAGGLDRRQPVGERWGAQARRAYAFDQPRVHLSLYLLVRHDTRSSRA